MRDQTKVPTERIKALLQEIEELRWWIVVAQDILPENALLPPIPSNEASAWEKAYRYARGGSIGYAKMRDSKTRSRIRQSDPEVELNRVRGRQQFGSLTPEQMAAIEKEIEEGEGK